MPANDRYKWIALSNTTLGVLMAIVNSSILLIAMPDIFRGIEIDPLAPGNTNYLRRGDAVRELERDLRGGLYHHADHATLEGEAVEPVPSGIAPALQRTS